MRHTPEAEYCLDAACLRKVLSPHIYCDKHQDKSSTPKGHPSRYNVLIPKGTNKVKVTFPTKLHARIYRWLLRRAL